MSYASANAWVDHTLLVREDIDAWSIALLDTQASVRTYALSGDARLVAVSDRAFQNERDAAAKVRALVADNQAQVTNAARTDADAEAVVSVLHDVVTMIKTGHQAEAVITATNAPVAMGTFRDAAAHMRAEEERLLVERRARASFFGVATLFSAVLLMVATCASLLLAWTTQNKRASALGALASDARSQLDVLSLLATKLAEARTRAEVVKIVVEQASRAVKADTCTLYLLDEKQTTLELVGERGVHPDVIERVRRITGSSETRSTFSTLKSREALWAENDAEYAALFPSLAPAMAEGRARAFWSMPLIVEDRAVGLLGMGFYEPRTFSDSDKVFVETLTRHCAQALSRATALEREDEAQRWFATTLQSIGDGVIATTGEGLIRFMNPIAERLTGWTLDEARGRPLDEVFCIFSERSRKTVENPVAKVLREGAVVGLANHTVLRTRKGEETPIDDSAAPIRDSGGQLRGVVLVFRDATNDKRILARREFLARAGEALASSMDYKTTLATVARFAVPELADWCSVDVVAADGASQQVAVAHTDAAKVRHAKELGERYPTDPDALTGVPQVLRSGKSELYKELPAALIEAGARDPEHLRLLRELRLESAMIVPLRIGGRVLGAMTFVYAESGRRYAQSDLDFAEDFARRAAMAIDNTTAMATIEQSHARERALREQAELANRAKDEFLATVSHELRTPLNAILGWTVLLRKRKLDPEVERPLAIIERNARAQTKLIEDVLDVSRIISGKLVLSLDAINVSEAVRAAVETITPSAQAKQIAISVEVEDASTAITGDSNRIQQVVWNLLTNAVKFTPNGGKVAIRIYAKDRTMCISVSDNGQGIRPEVLPLIFAPFHQADASTTRRHGGLGLGLAIVNQLVVAHGGTVAAHSDGEGRGAMFTVCLPKRSAVPAVEAAVTFDAVAARLDGLRVLVVDDQEDARMLVGAVLRDQGADVRLASSATEALEAFATSKPDVIVSDIGMPEVDGYTLMQTIRALPAAQGGGTPAIALTAFAQSEDAQRAFAAGYQLHITKPIDPTQLTAHVAHLARNETKRA